MTDLEASLNSVHWYLHGVHDGETNPTCTGEPMNFVRGGGSTNSVEESEHREWGSGGSSPFSQGFWRQL